MFLYECSDVAVLYFSGEFWFKPLVLQHKNVLHIWKNKVIFIRFHVSFLQAGVNTSLDK